MEKSVATLDNVSVLYKSENYLVVNKNYDVRINSDDPSHTVTVEHQLRKRFPELVDKSVMHGFRFQHRLDHATSGALCLSLSKSAAGKFHKCICKNQMVKHYLALVRGHVKPAKSPTIQHVNVAIGRDKNVTDFHKMCAVESTSCEKPLSAHTGVVFLEHGLYDDQPASKLLLIPYTGRTHQLRVHCQYLGHLIVGDYTYSDRTDTTPYRMMLHAYRLRVPIPGEHVDCTAPDPFTPETDNLWKPQRSFITYDDFLQLESEDLDICVEGKNICSGVDTLDSECGVSSGPNSFVSARSDSNSSLLQSPS